eukprot:5597091-Pleurochrysis_carterae.AAC.2
MPQKKLKQHTPDARAPFRKGRGVGDEGGRKKRGEGGRQRQRGWAREGREEKKTFACVRQGERGGGVGGKNTEN